MAQAMRYNKAHCKYSLISLRVTVIPALKFAPIESIKKRLRKARHYMFGYLEGLSGENDLEKVVKNYRGVARILNMMGQNGSHTH